SPKHVPGVVRIAGKVNEAGPAMRTHASPTLSACSPTNHSVACSEPPLVASLLSSVTTGTGASAALTAPANSKNTASRNASSWLIAVPFRHALGSHGFRQLTKLHIASVNARSIGSFAHG